MVAHCAFLGYCDEMIDLCSAAAEFLSDFQFYFALETKVDSILDDAAAVGVEMNFEAEIVGKSKMRKFLLNFELLAFFRGGI